MVEFSETENLVVVTNNATSFFLEYKFGSFQIRIDSDSTGKGQKHAHIMDRKGNDIYAVNMDGSRHDKHKGVSPGVRNIKIDKDVANHLKEKGWNINIDNRLYYIGGTADINQHNLIDKEDFDNLVISYVGFESEEIDIKLIQDYLLVLKMFGVKRITTINIVRMLRQGKYIKNDKINRYIGQLLSRQSEYLEIEKIYRHNQKDDLFLRTSTIVWKFKD